MSNNESVDNTEIQPLNLSEAAGKEHVALKIIDEPKTSASKLPINHLHIAYQSDDLFTFRNILRNSSSHGVIPEKSDESHVHLHIKKRTILFEPIPDENVSVFEKILSSIEEKSAKYICLIWKEFELWKKKEILTWERDGAKKLPYEFVLDSKNVKNLFSFLVFDWHNPNRHMGNKEKKYFLELKNKQILEKTGKSLFKMLYEIIENGEAYHEICLRIIYEYLAEMDERKIAEKKAKKSPAVEINAKEYHEDLGKLLSIGDVLDMKNEEYRIKILEVFVTYWNIFDKSFLGKKEGILRATNGHSTFFQLAFQLIERKHNQFEKEFTIFIDSTRNAYGHYYETILKPVVRLLLRIAENQKMTQVQTCIYHKCPYIELNSTPLTNFQEFYKFNNKNIFPFNKKEMHIFKKMEEAFESLVKLYSKKDKNNEKMNKQRDEYEGEILSDFLKHYKITAHEYKKDARSFFGGFSTCRNLLFEHHGRTDGLKKGMPEDNLPQESLFEKILKTPKMSKLIHVIWDEFELWRKEKVLKMINPTGKLLIDFVIESGDDRNLIAFLMPNLMKSDSLVNKKYFLKMQSEQYAKATGKTLFEHYLYIKDNEIRDEFFELCYYLIEESDFFVDIKKETCIDVALILANIDSYRDADEKSLSKNPDKDLILKIRDSPEAQIILEEIKDEDKKYDHEYDCEKLLKYFAAYWQTSDLNYSGIMQRLMNFSPFFKMMDCVLRKDQEEFIENFHANIDELVENYDKRYNRIEKNEDTLQKDLFILFRTAIKNDQRKIMDCILDYESFETLKFEIPCYKKAKENNHHAALKLLEHSYTIGEKHFPDDWITEQVMKEFVNEQIKVLDQDMIRMNTNFLLSPHDRKFKIKSKDDVDNQMLFCEYNDSLDFIVQSETLKDMILHPILSTYINLKSFKYQRVYEWNFVLFFFLYLLPFGFLITYHSFDDMNKTLLTYFLRALETLCITSTSLLTIREIAQMFLISKTLKKYFSHLSNWLELAMLSFSWILLAAIFYLNIDEHLEYFAFVSTLFIISSTIELLTMLPFPSMPLYMMMLKQVSETFLKFFRFFVFILFSFSISFCVIFRSKTMGNTRENTEALDVENSTRTYNETETENYNEPEEVYKNFDSLVGSFFKTVLMMSGEYTIEPFSLSPTRMIIFFFFVLTSFVLFNLILGLAIVDVQQLRDEAEMLTLRYEANKFVETAAKWSEFYFKFELEEKDIKDLVWWKKILTNIMRWLIINYCFIHKIGKIYVNMKTKEVSFEINRKQEAALTKYNGSVKKYFMDKEVFERLKQILKDRSEKEFAESKEEFDQKKEIEFLKNQLYEQTELLKSIQGNRK